uniref:Protein msta-like n=1 Tax=Drosophila rhopaloa TaxID=1041015 RepID=A0A6P4FLC3_DRORH
MLKARLEEDAVLGRCLATASSVERGDLVLEERPFARGPKRDSGIVCLGCYQFLQFGEDGDSLDRCELCDWPLCGSCADEDDATDHGGECQVFSAARVTFAGNVSDDGVCPQLDCITPLRVLLAKEANPGRWDSEVAPMEHHEEERRKDADVWHADRVNIAQYLRGPCKLASRFSEELIMQVVGVLEVNAFEARSSKGYPLRCLFPYTGILAHNCVPNTSRSIYPSEGYKIRLRAMVDLEEGQPLHHSYTYTLDGTAQRQAHLKQGKFFNCKCDRCLDPSELGTHFSSLKCGQCAEGYQVPRGATLGHDLLIEELPFAVGPKCNGPVVCLGCYEPDPDPEEKHCIDCGWPLCEECSRNEDNHHSQLECRVLRDARARFFPLPSGSSHCPQLDCIMPLR